MSTERAQNIESSPLLDQVDLPPSNEQPGNLSSTTYSLLEMEFTGVEDLLGPPLDPQPSPPQTDVANRPGSQSQEGDIKSQLEEIQLVIQQDMDKTKVMLTEMNIKQKEALQRQIETQMEYMLTQIQTSIEWRLKHHQTALLKQVSTILTPITASISCMQDDVTRLQGGAISFQLCHEIFLSLQWKK